MTTLQALSGTTVFLANIPDIRLGEAESLDVTVAAGSVQCFNETIYCEADGFCWLRDVLGLLRPHLPAGMSEIEVTVDLDVYYFNVFYCLNYIDNLSGTVSDWLSSHFLSTSEDKRTTKDSRERLYFYSPDNFTVLYQALYLLADGSHSTVTAQFSSDHTISTDGDIICYDFSPSVIDSEAEVDGQLLGYSVVVGSRSMRFLLDPTVDESQVSHFVYLNGFGFKENLSLVGTLLAPRQVDYTSVYLQGMRRSLSPQLQIPYKLTTALLTQDEIIRLTEMLSAESVWFAKSATDMTLVNCLGDLTFEPTSEPGKGVRAEFSFSYSVFNRRWSNPVHLQTFDSTFDQSFE